MDQDQIRSEIKLFKKQLDSVTRARTPMELRYFVIGRHEDRSRQWKQLLIECDEKWRALQEGEASVRLLALEIEELTISKKASFGNAVEKRLAEIANEKADIEIQRKRNQLDRLNLAMQGTAKEIVDYLHIAKTEYQDFFDCTEEDLEKHDRQYWINRYARQIQVDITTSGHIQAGNLGSMLQLPEAMQSEIMNKALEKTHEYGRLMAMVEYHFQKDKKQISNIKTAKITGGAES
jgi:phage anti-repressor protein